MKINIYADAIYKILTVVETCDPYYDFTQYANVYRAVDLYCIRSDVNPKTTADRVVWFYEIK